MPSDGTVSNFVEVGDDLFLKRGAARTGVELGIVPAAADANANKPNTMKATKLLPPTENELRLQRQAEKNKPTVLDEVAAGSSALLQCKNFGCQKKYMDKDNHSKACQHHSKPPIFHETRKYWACCPTSIAWDWDSFTAIPGCAFSKHTDIRQGKSFLGGTDVRKDKEEKYGPQRIDLPSKKAAPTSGLEKLSTLRKSLVSAGVKGLVFDDARDQIKEELTAGDETLGAKVWDKVLQRMTKRIENALS